MGLLASATFPEINALRETMGFIAASSVEAAARQFTAQMVASFESIVLGRVFLVLPFARLPAAEQAFARALVHADPRLGDTTPCLALVGSRGREPAWNDRRSSVGHRAIPLLDADHVASAPMLAKLLGDLNIRVAVPLEGGPVVTRLLPGGLNAAFYVQNASTAKDDRGRSVIPDQVFANKHGVNTVFGMGGSYVDGTLAVAVFFTTEMLERMVVDRYPSLIGNFKMATADLVSEGRIFDVDGA